MSVVYGIKISPALSYGYSGGKDIKIINVLFCIWLHLSLVYDSKHVPMVKVFKDASPLLSTVKNGLLFLNLVVQSSKVIHAKVVKNLLRCHKLFNKSMIWC